MRHIRTLPVLAPPSLAAVVLGLILAAGTAQAQAPVCPGPLVGLAGAVAFDEPLNEPDRLGLSRAIAKALRRPAGWPEKQIAAAPRCVIGMLDTGGEPQDILAGVEPAPLRWVRSDARKLTVFLVAGAEEGAVQPYYLMAKGPARTFVLRVYEGAPAEDDVRRDLGLGLEGHITPVAMYDPVGGAVSLFWPTRSGLTAFLAGPVATEARPATFIGPDGRYFTPTRRAALQMAGSGMLCPDVAGGLTRGVLKVNNGDMAGLDLACDYSQGAATLQLYVTRKQDRDPSGVFDTVVREVTQQIPEAHTAGDLIPRGVAGQLTYGQTWTIPGNTATGVWVGERGGYVFELRGAWPPEGAEAVRQALLNLQAAMTVVAAGSR
jgi:hypothetical protein